MRGAPSAIKRKRRSGSQRTANRLRPLTRSTMRQTGGQLLRCLAFLEGDIGVNAARTDLDASTCRVSCLQDLRRRLPATLAHRSLAPPKGLDIQKIVTKEGRPVKRAGDAYTRLCVSCHAANAEGIAGSSDDRTPLGAQEGMGCMDCHKGHGRKADASRGRCPIK